MTRKNVEVVADNSAELEAINLALSNLAGAEDFTEQDTILQEIEDNSVVEEDVDGEVVEAATSDTELTIEELKDLELTVVTQEAYASQKVTITGDAQPVVTTSIEAAKKAAKVRTPRGTATAAGARPAPRDLSTIAAEHFLLIDIDKALDHEDCKTAVLATRPGQVKIAEKFDNMISALSVGKAPSRYVMIAYAALKKTGIATSADIQTAMKAEGLRDGTAASQTGQIMVLFDTLRIATRTKNTLTLNSNSLFAEKLDKFVA